MDLNWDYLMAYTLAAIYTEQEDKYRIYTLAKLCKKHNVPFIDVMQIVIELGKLESEHDKDC